jgi:hypothetical protein
MAPEIIDKKLHVNGYLYLRSRRSKGRVYWDCRLLRGKTCTARAVTSDPEDGGQLQLFKGPDESEHSHPPDREEVAAEVITSRLKRKAAENPAEPPARILRTELQGATDDVLSQLPAQPALLRTMRRTRSKHAPANPKKLSKLREIPDEYQRTVLGERFLLSDSGPPDEEDEDSDVEEEEAGVQEEEPEAPRTIVFATRKNLELLCESAVWFVDGTFKTSPGIFAQVFTISGLRKRTSNRATEEVVALPLVYALLSGKEQERYEEVLEAVLDAINGYGLQCAPTRIMSDFELGIIRACRKVFPDVRLSCCFFHLGQIVYRRIQAAGLQQAYNDPDDRTLKKYTHMLLSLAFVPTADVPAAFRSLRRQCPPALRDVYDEFNAYYIAGRPAQGRRRGMLPRYPVTLWNQYDTAIEQGHRTNNSSEGWHNRFHMLMGKDHPDLYSFIKEIQSEQGHVEICVTELALGKRLRDAPKRKWVDLQIRLESVAHEYDINDVLAYLERISANVRV